MAKKETASQAPAKKKKNVEEAKPFTEAARLRVKYNEEVVPQAGEDRSQHGPGFREG